MLGGTRRSFLSCLAAEAGLLLVNKPSLSRADITLDIASAHVDVSPRHTISTTTYNGTAPGPVIRLREGVPVMVNIVNRTNRTEYVHWHGLEVSSAIDGTEEESSLAVPPGGCLQYHMTPRQTGSHYVHSHAMAMNDLTRGTYSGQFAFVYIEPRQNSGRYDQEIFLSTHEWDPYFLESDDDPGAMTEEHDGETDWGPSFVEIAYGINSINGKALGYGEPIRVKQGQRILFHILNASATENARLFLPGHDFVVIALDGNPVPLPRRVAVLELGVGERIDAFVDMKNPGVWVFGSTDDDVRGDGMGVLIEYAGKRGPASYVKPPEDNWDYTIFGEERESLEPEEVIPIVIDRLDPNGNGLERWAINGHVYRKQDEPQQLRKGRRYSLAITNRTADSHPLHLHRHTVELVKVAGKGISGLRKDVVVVQGYQDVEVDFTPLEVGLTLFHCHQQLHMDHGFKKLFRIT